MIFIKNAEKEVVQETKLNVQIMLFEHFLTLISFLSVINTHSTTIASLEELISGW